MLNRCSVDECNELFYAIDLCRNHYNINYRNGTPTPTYTCRNCKEDFVSKGRKMGNSHITCPKCFEIYDRFTYKRNGRYQNRFQYHGITVWDYYEIWKSQNGRCKLCEFEAETLHIDHDHSCCPAGNYKLQSCGNCIRGLLCRDCNVMLGAYENCKGILVIDQLENYLKESREK